MSRIWALEEWERKDIPGRRNIISEGWELGPPGSAWETEDSVSAEWGIYRWEWWRKVITETSGNLRMIPNIIQIGWFHQSREYKDSRDYTTGFKSTSKEEAKTYFEHWQYGMNPMGLGVRRCRVILLFLPIISCTALGKLWAFFRASVFVCKIRGTEFMNAFINSFNQLKCWGPAVSGAVLDIQDTMIKVDGLCLHGAQSR